MFSTNFLLITFNSSLIYFHKKIRANNNFIFLIKTYKHQYKLESFFQG